MLDPPYAASKVDSWELGFRSTFADDRLRLNAAFFTNDISDDHIFTFDFYTQQTAPENFDTKSHGAEIELDWKVSEALTVQASLNYTDATITGVPLNSFSQVIEGNNMPNSAY